MIESIENVQMNLTLYFEKLSKVFFKNKKTYGISTVGGCRHSIASASKVSSELV